MQEEFTSYTPDMEREVDDFVSALEIECNSIKPVNERTPEEVRRAQESGEGLKPPPILSDAAIVREIEAPHGKVPVRAFIPNDEIRGVYFHIHGGGWVLGRAHHRDSALVEILEECGAAVISVDYRLAPEYPYPAAQDDCEAVALWIMNNSEDELGTDKIVIGGESAGAHLSVETMLRMRDKHGFTGFSGANLMYGIYDLSMTPSQLLWGDRNLVLNTPIIRWFIDHYVPLEKRRDPDVSPLYASLHDLTTALFSVGTLDPLLDDTLFMHSRWFASGNVSSLNVYQGATHGFETQPTRLAEMVRDKVKRFIRECFQS